MVKNCKSCRFSHAPESVAELRQCRRYAPRPESQFVEWPTVEDFEWCGEWEQKQDTF